MAMKKRTKVTSSTTEKMISKEPAVKQSDVKEAVIKESAAKDSSEKETEVKKPAVKKPVVKKPAARKEIKVKAFVEYYGKQVEEKDMIADVKKAWTKSGKKVSDIKTMELYIKPEEAAVYYVINGTETGAVAF